MARGCIVPTCAAGNTKCGWIGCTWMVPFWPSWRWSRARSTGGPGGQSAALTRACPPGPPQRAVLAWLRRCERLGQRYLLRPRPGLTDRGVDIRPRGVDHGVPAARLGLGGSYLVTRTWRSALMKPQSMASMVQVSWLAYRMRPR